MPLLVIDPIVRGQTKSLHRTALLQVLKSQTYERYYSPAAGDFSDVETMVAAGVPPSKITASDVSLFASVLGYLLDPSKKVIDLGITVSEPDAKAAVGQFQGVDIDDAAKALFAIKCSQLQPTNDYAYWQRREFIDNAQTVIKQYEEMLAALHLKCAGLKYEIRDCAEHLNEVGQDPQALIVYTPPWFTGRYGTNYKGNSPLVWAGAQTKRYDAKYALAAFDAHEKQAAHVLVYIEEKIQKKLSLDVWHRVLVEQKTDRLYRYLLSNRPTDTEYERRPKLDEIPKTLYPVYLNEDITVESEVRFLVCDKLTAMYYYDLMVKGLGMPGSESYALLLIDGKVAGVTGLHLRHWRTSRLPSFHDVFAITLPEDRYKLGRLMTHLLCLRSTVEEFIRVLYPDSGARVRMETYQTTFLSNSPSIMKVRGIMKLIHREDMPNGQYKLRYITTLKNETTKEVLSDWLKRQG